MNSKSPLNIFRGIVAGLSAALVVGCGLSLAHPTSEASPVSDVEMRLIVDGQETHGKGGKGRAIRVADGQQTHGKGGKGIA
jgi:hypothetical protein